MIFQSEGRKIRRRLNAGAPLLLEPEETQGATFTTTMDPHCVAVFLGNGQKVKLGHVPKTHSRMIRELIEKDAIRGCTVYRVETDDRGYWKASFMLHFFRPSGEYMRVRNIMQSMIVPNPDYAAMIAAACEADSRAEKEWIQVYNETCTDPD
jgi:hypothetical protein